MKKAAALLKREGTAFVKFIGQDVSDVTEAVSKYELKERVAIAAKQSEFWQETQFAESAGR